MAAEAALPMRRRLARGALDDVAKQGLGAGVATASDECLGREHGGAWEEARRRMNAVPIQAGFSCADTSYPQLTSTPANLTVTFRSSSGDPVAVAFTGVAAFSWRENSGELLPGEPWDSACELFGSELLALHAAGQTMHAAPGLRHLRFQFNVWGCLDVLCTGFGRVDDADRGSG